MLISISFYGPALIGETLGWYLAHELDFERLKVPHESSPPGPGDWVMSLDKGSSGEWISVTKEIADPVETDCKTGGSTSTKSTERSQKNVNTTCG